MVKKRVFLGKIIISSKEKTELEAKKTYLGLTIWLDGSKLESGASRAGIT
jgi:hypothetical protein